ncbi:MAG: hypothetical protein Q9170_005273 [Blastenia crenularia]
METSIWRRGLVRPLIEDTKQRPNGNWRVAELTDICQQILTACAIKKEEGLYAQRIYGWNTQSSLSDETLGLVARAAIQQESPALFESAAIAAKENLPVAVFSTLREMLTEANLEQWRPGFVKALGCISKVHLRWKALVGALSACKTSAHQISSSPDANILEHLVQKVIESTLSKPEQPNLNPIEASDIARLLENCRSMDLTEERRALMNQVVASSKTVVTAVFESLFTPLLICLIEIFQAEEVSMNDFTSRVFFKSILDQYVRLYVGPERAKPLDWTQLRRGCGCQDCGMLDRFLTGPNQQIGKFSMAEKRRSHLERRLSGSGCTLDTERRGSLHTLVATKTMKNWHAAHKAWRDRCEVAKQSFQAIGTRALQEILGDDYERCTDVSSTRSRSPTSPVTGTATGVPAAGSLKAWNAAMAQQSTPRQPLAAVSQPSSKSIDLDLSLWQQRSRAKPQIIDLTED